MLFVEKSEGPLFDRMVEDLLSAELVGFDAENRCTSTKYEQQGVSLLQFSNRKIVYIVDFLKLEADAVFLGFFIKLLQSEKIKKIGHTVQSDIRYL